MFKLLSSRKVQSAKNGEIVVRTWFGTPIVIVDDYFQSGPYMRDLWRKAIRHVPASTSANRLLLLGLGGGSAIGEIHLRFPHVGVTAIEWDPVMVQLARELNLFPAEQMPDVILGDAVKEMPRIKTKFDLILIDLFKGENPEARLSSPEFIQSIVRALAPGGQIILNAFKAHALIEAFGRHAERVRSWRYKYNQLALFRVNSSQPIVES